MPWYCPACRTEILHTPELEDLPAAGQTYRCHVCRIELVFDPHARRMTVAPYEVDLLSKPQFDRRTKTLIPLPVERDRRKRQRRHSDN